MRLARTKKWWDRHKAINPSVGLKAVTRTSSGGGSLNEASIEIRTSEKCNTNKKYLMKKKTVIPFYQSKTSSLSIPTSNKTVPRRALAALNSASKSFDSAERAIQVNRGGSQEA